MDTQEIADIYDISKMVQSLLDKKEIIGIENQENKRVILYPNDKRFDITVDPYFKSIWKGIKAQNISEVRSYLAEKKIAGAKTEVKRFLKPSRTKKDKKIRKVSNIHVENVDLSKEYKPQENVEDIH